MSRILLLERAQALVADQAGTVALEHDEFRRVDHVGVARTRERHRDLIDDAARAPGGISEWGNSRRFRDVRGTSGYAVKQLTLGISSAAIHAP
jgi:hypothetical protein